MSKFVAVRRSASVAMGAVSALVTAGCQSDTAKKVVVRPVTAEVRPTTELPATPATPVTFMSVQPASEDPPVRTDDVVGWSMRGVNKDVIIDRIGRSGTTFHLGTADEIRLRDAGVPDDVVHVMRGSGS